MSELWTMREPLKAEEDRLADLMVAAVARGESADALERAYDQYYERLWAIDEQMMTTTPRSLAEHAVMVTVLELRSADAYPDDLLAAYFATIRRMALA